MSAVGRYIHTGHCAVEIKDASSRVLQIRDPLSGTLIARFRFFRERLLNYFIDFLRYVRIDFGWDGRIVPQYVGHYLRRFVSEERGLSRDAFIEETAKG